MRIFKALCTSVLLAASVPAHALTFNFTGDDYTGTNDIASPVVVATAVFKQESATTVSLVLKLNSGISGDAFVSNAYFNYGGDLTKLSAAYDSGNPLATNPAINPVIALNDQNAGGGQKFDILVAYSTANDANRLTEGEFTKIIFTGTAPISVDDFQSGSVSGSYLAALHIQGLVFPGVDGTKSGWFVPVVGPDGPGQVPLPAALPLFATILAGGGLVAWRRRRKQIAA